MSAGRRPEGGPDLMPVCGLRNRIKIPGQGGAPDRAYKCCDARDCPYKSVAENVRYCRFDQQYW